MLREIALFDKLVWPERLEQIIFAHNAVAMIQQEKKKIEALAAQRYGFRSPCKRPAGPIDDIVFETDKLFILKQH
jgi:hypothetical protein